MKIEEVLAEADKALYSLKIEDAIIYLETALEINPNNIEALIKLSKIALTRDEKVKVVCENSFTYGLLHTLFLG